MIKPTKIHACIAKNRAEAIEQYCVANWRQLIGSLNTENGTFKLNDDPKTYRVRLVETNVHVIEVL